MRKRTRPGLRNEKGQSYVEFTLILPIALFLIFGVIDLGKAISYWLDSGHLANQGARYAVVQGCPENAPCSPASLNYPTELLQAVIASSETPQLRSKATVCLKDLSSTPPYWQVGNELRMTVISGYNFIPFLHISATTKPIQGRSDMRLETTWANPPASNLVGAGPDATNCSSISS